MFCFNAIIKTKQIYANISFPCIYSNYLSLLQILNQLLWISGVVGCGEKHDTIYALIDEDGDVLETTKRIAQTLGVVSFSYHTVSKPIRYLKYSGAPITCIPRKKSYGTLGGFLTVDNNLPIDKQEVYAFTAGHVSTSTDKLKLISNDQYLGSFLGPWTDQMGPDINVANIFPEFVAQCDFKVKDDTGHRKDCFLLDLEKENLVSNLIHINGASSGISFGEIVTRTFRIDGYDGTFMLLQDRQTIEGQSQLCKPGDSGAIICSNDRRGRFVNVLGILIGKFDSREERHTGTQYLALQIQSGLNHLNQRYKKRFRLCEQYAD